VVREKFSLRAQEIGRGDLSNGVREENRPLKNLAPYPLHG
jgi:hypothetical protein